MSLKSTLTEFKEFAVKGNVIDMAVGVIVGGAFGKIVTSIVNDIIMPIVGIAIGGIDFSSLFIATDGNTYATADAAIEAGAGVIKYGAFISQVIDFLIIAIIIFIMLKVITNLKKKETPAEPEAPTTKVCPFCRSEISIEATKCPHCTSDLPAEAEAE